MKVVGEGPYRTGEIEEPFRENPLEQRVIVAIGPGWSVFAYVGWLFHHGGC